ncbi:acyl-CoA dehydrogenase family protein [Phenylobacterium sp.]|jgi:alkylation response protein AidB-like acyl-CoA dehydrogenase|uniref:acyl-CoA dehydrogenase family protein n=1 Tax=Phenylobacterium sp. TaxID=1871053 RepID=UPI0037846D59
MDFNFTSEQDLLRDSLQRYLQDAYDFPTREATIKGEAGWRPEVWKAFAEELGILAAPFPEELGGLGGGAVDTLVIMETLGGALVVEPFLETVVLAGGVLKRLGGDLAADLIGKIIAGEATFAFAHNEPEVRYGLAEVSLEAVQNGDGWTLSGVKDAVNAAPWASHLLVTARTAGARGERAGVSLFLVEAGAKGLALSTYPTVDGGRAADIRFDGVPAVLLGEAGKGLDLLEPAVDEATAAVCAEALGVMRRLHADTLDYAKQRKQFGLPLAAFQVLQHRMVDMFIAIEQAVSITYMATMKLEKPAAERARAISAAKVRVGKSCREVGQSAIQIHGGMGMTMELAVSHYFKRATVLEQMFGGIDHHLSRFESLPAG